MSSSPLVSIGLPIFNGGESIESVVNSLLNQSYPNFEIVISDNGSTDETPARLAALQKEDSRIKVFLNESNMGSIWNFNNVFLKSQGEYFMWASHDDHHEPDFILACVTALEKDKSAVLCSPNIKATIDGSDEIVWVAGLHSFRNRRKLLERYRETLKHFPAASLYGMYRSSSMARTKLFPNVIGGDLLLIQELSLLGPFIEEPEILFTYYGRPRWNSVDQDFMTFFGRPKKPWWYSPFLMVFLFQIRQLKRADVTLFERYGLTIVLFRYQLGQFTLKVLLKFLKYLLPGRFKLKVATYIYWRFMNGPNVRALNLEKFSNRIIKPRIGWFG